MVSFTLFVSTVVVLPSLAWGQVPTCKPVTFQESPRFEGALAASSIRAVDVNNDGIEDLLTGNSTSRTISVQLGTGAGAFGPTQSYLTTIDANAMALGDINGDGRVDAVVGSNANVNQIAVLLNNGESGH